MPCPDPPAAVPGDAPGEALGEAPGEAFGDAPGEALGEADGEADDFGDAAGVALGDAFGVALGEGFGVALGEGFGLGVGVGVGFGVGVGDGVGFGVGLGVGFGVGVASTISDLSGLISGVGTGVGSGVGSGVGRGVGLGLGVGFGSSGSACCIAAAPAAPDENEPGLTHVISPCGFLISRRVKMRIPAMSNRCAIAIRIRFRRNCGFSISAFLCAGFRLIFERHYSDFINTNALEDIHNGNEFLNRQLKVRAHDNGGVRFFLPQRG